MAFLLSFENIKVLWFTIGAYTAPGFLSSFCAIVNLILVAKYWGNHSNEEMIACRHKQKEETQNKLPEGSQLIKPRGLHTNENVRISTELIVVLTILLIMYFCIQNCLSVFETISTPLTMESYGWDVPENAILWVAIVS